MLTDSIAPRHVRQAAALLAGILRELEGGTSRAAVVGDSYSDRLDERARAIVDIAQGSGSARDRAIKVVQSILSTYFRSETTKVHSFVYSASDPGLSTLSFGRGSTAQGRITVGDKFLKGTDARNFARRVLQFRHELDHIDQYRLGYTGDSYKAYREYAAYKRTATLPEYPGTGLMTMDSRIKAVDAALCYWNCLSESTRNSSSYQAARDNLLAWRKYYLSKTSTTYGPPPSGCPKSYDSTGRVTYTCY